MQQAQFGTVGDLVVWVSEDAQGSDSVTDVTRGERWHPEPQTDKQQEPRPHAER